MRYRYIQTPIGKLLLAGKTDGVLEIIGFPQGKGVVEPQPDWIADESVYSDCETQLREYFAGTRQEFNLTVAPSGTPFQRDVLAALQMIPYGETVTYQDIAHQVGRPKAVRAVGAANGRNPIPIVIPCHRVIGADGSLTGFGGGLPTKRYLLNLEGRAFQLT